MNKSTKQITDAHKRQTPGPQIALTSQKPSTKTDSLANHSSDIHTPLAHTHPGVCVPPSLRHASPIHRLHTGLCSLMGGRRRDTRWEGGGGVQRCYWSVSLPPDHTITLPILTAQAKTSLFPAADQRDFLDAGWC